MSECKKGGLSPLGEADERLPKVFNIESDPREEHDFGEMHEWVIGPLLKALVEYNTGLETHPNPPAANMAWF